MKCVILAGGLGSRLGDETSTKPKPMVEIGSKPILWHIMKYYSCFGVTEFIICLGYKGQKIKQYFSNYGLINNDIQIDLDNQSIKPLDKSVNVDVNWKVSLIETGETTETGGRLKRVLPLIGNEPFLFTYGDGLANVDIQATIDQHLSSKKVATMTVVQPQSRFGVAELDGNDVCRFQEKPKEPHWVNGGFFVLSPDVDEFITDDNSVFESETLVKLAEVKKLGAYRHNGFWHPMDNRMEHQSLTQLWESKNSPWKIWNEK